MTLARAGRLARIGMHAALIPIMLALAAVAGWQAGDWHWPYKVRSIDVETPEVDRGGVLRIVRVVDYLDDCEIRHERRMQSIADPHVSLALPEEEPPGTPFVYNGRPQTLRFSVPRDFPCGPAQIRSSPSVACNQFQELIYRQRSRDVLIPFDVGGPGCPAPR